MSGPISNADIVMPLRSNSVFLWILRIFGQGMKLIAAASKANDWNVNLGEAARIWKVRSTSVR